VGVCLCLWVYVDVLYHESFFTVWSFYRFLLCNQATQPAVHHLSTSFKRALSVQVSEDRDHSTSPPTPPGDEEEVPITDIDSLQELNRNDSQSDSKQQQDEVARLTIEVFDVICDIATTYVVMFYVYM